MKIKVITKFNNRSIKKDFNIEIKFKNKLDNKIIPTINRKFHITKITKS